MRSYLTYANVMATIAVFLTLGGTSYAVATGSIDSREIANNTIRGADVRNETIRSNDVDDGSLKAKDFAPGQLPAGPQGTPGVPGAPGRDATNLFASIRDEGSSTHAAIQYGEGVTEIWDNASTNAYLVTFDRSVRGVRVPRHLGWGRPAGATIADYGMPIITPSGDDQVVVQFIDETPNTLSRAAATVSASVSAASCCGRQRSSLRARCGISTGVRKALSHCACAGTSGSAVAAAASEQRRAGPGRCASRARGRGRVRSALPARRGCRCPAGRRRGRRRPARSRRRRGARAGSARPGPGAR